MTTISQIFNFKLVSPNVQEHWTKRHKRNRQHAVILKNWWRHLKETLKPPCTVTITRIAPREIDSDNLQFSGKGIRDSISALLIPGLAPGQADGKGSGITWEYKQERGEPKQYSVRIEFQQG